MQRGTPVTKGGISNSFHWQCPNTIGERKVSMDMQEQEQFTILTSLSLDLSKPKA